MVRLQGALSSVLVALLLALGAWSLGIDMRLERGSARFVRWICTT